MTKRIPKRVREEAAVICAIAASMHPRRWTYEGIAEQLEFDRGSLQWALYAWMAAIGRSPWRDWQWFHDAEAEAMLRAGWSP